MDRLPEREGQMPSEFRKLESSYEIVKTQEKECDSISQSYFGWCRYDVIAAVPEQAHTVLSVGCGAGFTEAELIKRGKTVVGLEMDRRAAEHARLNGIEVIEGDATTTIDLLKGRMFDCILYADVLEHLAIPEELLDKHLSLLKPGGVVVISVPNFRHCSVILALLRGEFKYESAGIFDRTHLRITTRQSVLRWLSGLGLENIYCKFPIHSRRDQLVVALSMGLLREFLAKQVVVAGRKRCLDT